MFKYISEKANNGLLFPFFIKMNGEAETQISSSAKYYYIHDMISTLISNQRLISYISENRMDMNRIPSEIKDYLLRNSDRKMEVIVLQCYEYNNSGIQQNEKHLVTVIGHTYTHYVEDNRGEFELSKCGADEFDFETNQYKLRRYRKECSYSEEESNKRVLELVRQGENVCGNSHKYINEFCYNLYKQYIDKTQFKGRLIKIPQGFTYPLLMQSRFIKSEIVIFGDASNLEIVDDSDIKSYDYNHKTLSLDIETLLVDEEGNRKEDEIIQISLVYQEGNRLRRCIGVTQRHAITDSTFYNFEEIAAFFDQRRMPDVEVYCVKDEKHLIETFKEIVYDVKPDYLAGYNVAGFDFQILLKSANRYSIDLIDDLSPIRGFEANKFHITRALNAFKKRQLAKKLDNQASLSLLEDSSLFEISCRLFPGMLINDLYRCHKGEKLDEIAITQLGIGKEDVSYSDIPTLFYSCNDLDRSNLLKYNIKDSLLVAALICTSDNFCSYKFFVTSSYIAKVPHSEFYNQQKSPLLAAMFYYEFKKKGMLQELKIKPSRESDKLCITELIHYYLYYKGPNIYWLTTELIEKFNSGEIKTKTAMKHFDFHSHYGNLKSVNFSTALEMLHHQFHTVKEKNTKHGFRFYTLTHLMLFLRFLAEGSENSCDVENVITDYYKQNFLGRYAKLSHGRSKSKYVSNIDDEKKMTAEIISFIKYLSRRSISASHTADNLANAYIENEMVNVKHKGMIRHFAVYLNGNSSGVAQSGLLEFLIRFNESKGPMRFSDRYTPDTFCEEVVKLISPNLLMKFDTPFKYDGAYVCLPKPGIENEYPICCLDYSSMYPCLGISHNMGPETIITQNKIRMYNLKEGIDYDQINLYSRDDHRSVSISNLNANETSNYICFLKPKYSKSVIADVWRRILDKRLVYKRLIGTFSDSDENRRVKEMSDTFKITANSVYGVLPLMGSWKISAAITSKGRQNIQNVASDIERTHHGVTVYGDTDSVMFHFKLNTDKLCSLYDDGTLLAKGWIKDQSSSVIRGCNETPYKKGCLIAAEISKCIANDLNSRHLQIPQTAIHFPPSKLEHEKVMLPFVIFNQKHYFAKIMDDAVNENVIFKGLECCKRTKLQATDEIEKVMFSDLLRKSPSTWNTYKLSCFIVKQIINDRYDLKKICSRKKITVTSNRLLKSSSDAGIQLFQRMKQRGEITDTAGLDKITVQVVKVTNSENANRVKYESLAYLTKLQEESKPLHLDMVAIVKQILREVVSIMKVIHPERTYTYFADLLKLKTSETVDESEFRIFVKPLTEKKKKNILQAESCLKDSDTTRTIHHFFQSTPSSSTSIKRKAVEYNQTSPRKRMKQTKLNFLQ